MPDNSKDSGNDIIVAFNLILKSIYGIQGEEIDEVINELKSMMEYLINEHKYGNGIKRFILELNRKLDTGMITDNQEWFIIERFVENITSFEIEEIDEFLSIGEPGFDKSPKIEFRMSNDSKYSNKQQKLLRDIKYSIGIFKDLSKSKKMELANSNYLLIGLVASNIALAKGRIEIDPNKEDENKIRNDNIDKDHMAQDWGYKDWDDFYSTI